MRIDSLDLVTKDMNKNKWQSVVTKKNRKSSPHHTTNNFQLTLLAPRIQEEVVDGPNEGTKRKEKDSSRLPDNNQKLKVKIQRIPTITRTGNRITIIKAL